MSQFFIPSDQDIQAEIADLKRQLDEAISQIQHDNLREGPQLFLSPIAHETLSSNTIAGEPESVRHGSNVREDGPRYHSGQQAVLGHLVQNGSAHAQNTNFPPGFSPHENTTTARYMNNLDISQQISMNRPNSSNTTNNPVYATGSAAVDPQHAPLVPQTNINQLSSPFNPSFHSHSWAPTQHERPPLGSPAPSVHSLAPPSDGNFNLESVVRKMALDLENLNGKVADLHEQFLDHQPPSSVSDNQPCAKGSKAERPRSRQRTLMMMAVRLDMNKLLGIKLDSQITNVILDTMVDENTIRSFNAGLIQCPPLKPLRLNFDKPRCDWNVELSRKFADQLPRPDPQCLWSSEDIAEHFLTRIEALERVLRANLPISPDESSDQLASRLLARRQRSLHEKRIRKRQSTLRTIRMKTALARANGGRDPAWTALYNLADRIGINGHSSDETDNENGGYAVRTKPWRSREIGRLLRFIDANYNSKNAYGNNKGGARSHTRRRDKKLVYSRHDYVKGLSHNIYDPGWLSALTALQRETIGITNINMNLPIIQEPESTENGRLLFQEHRV